MADVNKSMDIVISAKDQASSAFTGIQKSVDAAKASVDSLQKSLEKPVEIKVQADTSGQWTRDLADAAQRAQGYFTPVVDAAKGAYDKVAGVFSSVSEAYQKPFSTALNVVEKGTSAMVGAVSNAFAWLKDAASGAMAALTGGLSTLVGGGMSIITSLIPSKEALMSPLSTMANGLFSLQDAIKSYSEQGILKLAKIGGAFQEQSTQFAIYADSMGKNSNDMLRMLEDVSNGSLTMQQKIALGTKAVTSGLSMEDLQTAMAYVKKFTESSGQDFDSMAQTIFGALSSGRYAVLKQMGLIIEEGASASDAISQMKDRMALFGDTGFNTADAIDKVVAKVSDFVTKIGEAVNNSEAFKRVIKYVSDGVAEFVASFDYASFGNFFDNLIRSAEVVYVALRDTFQGVYESIRDTFKRLGTSAGGSEVFNALVSASIGAAKGIVSALQMAANLVLPIAGDMAGGVIKLIGDAYTFAETGAIRMAASISKYFTKALISIGQILGEIGNSTMGSMFGLDADVVQNTMMHISSAAAKTTMELQAMAEAGKKTSVVGDALSSLGQKIKDASNTTYTFGDRFAKIADEAKANMAKFQLPAIEPPTARDEATARKAGENLAKIRAEAEAAAKEEAAKKAADKAEKDRKDEEARENEYYDKRKETIKKRLDEINKIIADSEKMDRDTTFKIMPADYGKLKEEQAALLKVYNQIQEEESKATKNRSDEVLKSIAAYERGGSAIKNYLTNVSSVSFNDPFKNFSTNLTNQFNAQVGVSGKFFETGRGEIEVRHKEQVTEQSMLDSLFSKVSWPAALQDLAKVIIAEIVSQMRGERLPMVVTSAA